MISNEQLLVAVIGLLLAAGYVMRRWADATLVKANADLEAVKSDATTMNSIMTALHEQVEINRQQNARDKRWRRIMLEEREARREGYNVIRGVQNDTNTVLVNLYNAVQGQPDIIVEKLGTTLPAVMMGILEQTKVAYHQEMTSLVGELGEVLRQKLAFDRFSYETARFPAADDPEWREDWITPLVPELILHRSPSYDDDARLRKPCARINPTGEQVKLITGRYPEWLVVKKAEKVPDGDMECWGYLPANKVKLGREETVLLEAMST